MGHMTTKEARGNPVIWEAVRRQAQVEHRLLRAALYYTKDLAPGLPSGVKAQTLTGSPALPPGAIPPKRRWSNAVRTPCACGRTHASRMEARVCQRLRGEMPIGATLYHQVRFPLLSVGPKRSGVPETICVDFVEVLADRTWRAIDAKSPTRVSRDWRLRTGAFKAFYGRPVEEVDR